MDTTSSSVNNSNSNSSSGNNNNNNNNTVLPTTAMTTTTAVSSSTDNNVVTSVTTVLADNNLATVPASPMYNTNSVKTETSSTPNTETVVGSTPPPHTAAAAALIQSQQQSLIETTYPRFLDEVSKYAIDFNPATYGVLSYGTAGFRTDATMLNSTCHRMGMLATLRARKMDKIVGLMVTASHNLEVDNGLKIIDSNGGMLAASWEGYCTALANAETDKQVAAVLDSIILKEKIDLERTGNIFIAKDTRVSSEHLSELAREGALLIGGNVLDFSLQTTPQLHHLVRMWNHEKYNKGDWASEAGYYHMLVDAFKQLVASLPSTHAVTLEASSRRNVLVMDAAHGVGAIQMSKLMNEWPDSLKSYLTIETRNIPADGQLNVNCGAEHCQKGRKPPAGFSSDADRMKRCVSIDGDADRLVYHYYDTLGMWHLLDGDKIAALYALFFQENLAILGDGVKIAFGVVQTAYANGASTSYIQNLGVNVKVAKTGVKYCHEVAVRNFDIGCYFEANGHGTVIIKDQVVEMLSKLEYVEEDKKIAVMRLLGAYQTLNQAVGDAFADLLMVEYILVMKSWTISDWDAIYQDLPSRQTKVPIEDRSIVITDETETIVQKPDGIQASIEALVKEMNDAEGSARAFVRPSGTENVVRVYAEGKTDALADELALKVAKIVHSQANGQGPEPTEFMV